MACVQYQASKTVKWLRELAGFQSSSGSSSANSAFDWVAIVHDVVPIPAAFFALCILWTIIQHRFCSARPGPGTSADSHANEEIRNDALLSGDAVKQPQTNNNNNSNRIHYGHPFLSAPAAYPGEKSTASRQNVRKSKHVTPWKENVVYNSDEDVEMKLLGGADRKPQLSSTRKNKKDGKRRNNQHVKECEENVVIVPQSASLQASRQNTTTVWSTMESQQSPSHTEDINGNEQKGNKAHSCSARFWFFLTWTFVLSVLYLVVTVQLVSTLESTSSLLDGVADQRETLLSAVRSVLLGISDILSVISDVCYQINDEFDDIASKLPVSPNTLTTINDYLESLPVDRLRQGLQATCTAINAAAPLLILANFAAICGLVISKQSERQSSQWFAFQFARAVAIITVCVSTMALVVAMLLGRCCSQAESMLFDESATIVKYNQYGCNYIMPSSAFSVRAQTFIENVNSTLIALSGYEDCSRTISDFLQTTVLAYNQFGSISASCADDCDSFNKIMEGVCNHASKTIAESWWITFLYAINLQAFIFSLTWQ